MAKQIGVLVLGEGVDGEAWIDRTKDEYFSTAKVDKYGNKEKLKDIFFKKVDSEYIELWQED